MTTLVERRGMSSPPPLQPAQLLLPAATATSPLRSPPQPCHHHHTFPSFRASFPVAWPSAHRDSLPIGRSDMVAARSTASVGTDVRKTSVSVPPKTIKCSFLSQNNKMFNDLSSAR
jgi:hypothetical protein